MTIKEKKQILAEQAYLKSYYKKVIQRVLRYDAIPLTTARIEQNAANAFDMLYSTVCNYYGIYNGSIDYGLNDPKIQAFINKFK